MKTFGLLLCMALVAGTLMATPITTPTSMEASVNGSPALLQAIFGETPSQASTGIDFLNALPSECGRCKCDLNQACTLNADGSCSCG